MSYWLCVGSLEGWNDPNRDKSLIGFPAGRKKSVKEIKPGHRIVIYVKGIQRFNAVYEVIGRAPTDPNYQLGGQSFPERVRVKELAVERPENGIAISTISQDLNEFKKLKEPTRWSSIVRMSARRLDDSDGETILRTLQGNIR